MKKNALIVALVAVLVLGAGYLASGKDLQGRFSSQKSDDMKNLKFVEEPVGFEDNSDIVKSGPPDGKCDVAPTGFSLAWDVEQQSVTLSATFANLDASDACAEAEFPYAYQWSLYDADGGLIDHDTYYDLPRASFAPNSDQTFSFSASDRGGLGRHFEEGAWAEMEVSLIADRDDELAESNENNNIYNAGFAEEDVIIFDVDTLYYESNDL